MIFLWGDLLIASDDASSIAAIVVMQKYVALKGSPSMSMCEDTKVHGIDVETPTARGSNMQEASVGEKLHKRRRLLEVPDEGGEKEGQIDDLVVQPNNLMPHFDKFLENRLEDIITVPMPDSTGALPQKPRSKLDGEVSEPPTVPGSPTEAPARTLPDKSKSPPAETPETVTCTADLTRPLPGTHTPDPTGTLPEEPQTKPQTLKEGEVLVFGALQAKQNNP